jgi:DNA mismatch repair ATPase MutL
VLTIQLCIPLTTGLQVDRKFIMMVCGGVLVALDQHAADERVRLEALQAALLQQAGPRRGGLLDSVALRAPQVGMAAP